jgi:hypothetical protein
MPADGLLARMGEGAGQGLLWGAGYGAVAGAACALPLGLFALAYWGWFIGAIVLVALTLFGATAGALLGAGCGMVAGAAGAAVGSVFVGTLFGLAGGACAGGVPLFLVSDFPDSAQQVAYWEQESRTRDSESGREEARVQTASLSDNLNWQYGLCTLGAVAEGIAGAAAGLSSTRRALRRRV